MVPARHLVLIDQTVASPPNREQPSSWRRDRWVRCRGVRRRSPPVEPASRRRRIDRRHRAGAHAEWARVAPRVEQHVGQRVSHLARRAQNAHVRSVVERAANTPEHTIDGPRESRRERFHAVRQIAGARGLDDRVHVIGLDRVVDQPEAPALPHAAEGALRLRDESSRSQRRYLASHADRHVAGMPRGERRAPGVPIATANAGLASCSRTAAAPARNGPEIEVELARPARHGRILTASCDECGHTDLDSRAVLAVIPTCSASRPCPWDERSGVSRVETRCRGVGSVVCANEPLVEQVC